MDHEQIAKIIFEQLGGGRFVAMTGARGFASHAPEKGSRGALSFRLPSRFAKDGINSVRISLTPLDTYTVTFSKIGPTPSWKQLLAGKRQKATVVSTHADIYCDQLQELFTQHTGLDIHL